MELKSTVQSYDELLSLDMFRENQEVTLENFENIKSLDVDSKGDRIFGDIYFSKSECYLKMCELTKNLNKLIFKDIEIQIKDLKIKAENYPFFTEMLLFQIADDIIFDDIKQSINVNLKETEV